MLKYPIKLIMLLLLVHLVLATPMAISAMDETILISCQATGHALYNSCVAKPPITPDEVAACSALKVTYLACLVKLTIPHVLTPSTDSDPYSYSPFTPCEFETGHLILFDICPNTIK